MLSSNRSFQLIFSNSFDELRSLDSSFSIFCSSSSTRSSSPEREEPLDNLRFFDSFSLRRPIHCAPVCSQDLQPSWIRANEACSSRPYRSLRKLRPEKRQLEIFARYLFLPSSFLQPIPFSSSRPKMVFSCLTSFVPRPRKGKDGPGSRTIQRERRSPPLAPRDEQRIQTQTRCLLQARKEVFQEEHIPFEDLSKGFIRLLDQLDDAFSEAGVPQAAVDAWCTGFQTKIEFNALPEDRQRLAYRNLQALMESTRPVSRAAPLSSCFLHLPLTYVT